MTYSLEEFDAVLSRTQPISASTPTTVLRQWRTELVRASVFISYAIGVLSLDVEMLNRAIAAPNDDVLQSLIDELPSILTSGWVGGGWSLSPDASASVGAAAELAKDQAESLLWLHAELVTSDLSDPVAVRDLLTRIEEYRQALTERRGELENRIREIQKVVLQQYATGAASIEDWLT